MTNIITERQKMNVVNLAQMELNGKLDQAIQNHILDMNPRSLQGDDSLKKDVLLKSLVHNCHMAGATESGVLDTTDIPGGTLQQHESRKQFPNAVQLATDVYTHRKNNMQEKEIERQLHGQLMGNISSGNRVTAVGVMASIAIEKGQIKPESKGVGAAGVMADIYAANKK